MDNIIMKKIWQDGDLIELKISASSEYVSAYQTCYIQEVKLEAIAEKISQYTFNYNDTYYMEFGNKQGNYTPAFSMCILPADMSGHVKIEVDIEIDDNDTRCHRCCFYVQSELGLIEKLGASLKYLAKEPIGYEATLCEL